MLNNFEHSAADDFSESSKDFSHLSKLAVIVALQKEAQPILQGRGDGTPAAPGEDPEAAGRRVVQNLRWCSPEGADEGGLPQPRP